MEEGTVGVLVLRINRQGEWNQGPLLSWRNQGPRLVAARGLLAAGLIGGSSYPWGKIFIP